MGKNSFLKRNWKAIVNILTLTVLTILVILIWDQIVATYQEMFALLGHRLHYKFMARVALELNFVNTVFPSGGVSGISYFGVRMRSADITGTQASLVQIMKLLLMFISFEALLVVGLLILAIEGQANDLLLLIAGSVTTLLLVGTLGFVAIIGSERRIHTTFTTIAKGINKLIKLVRLNKGETISMVRAEGMVKDLHFTYKVIESKYKELRWPLLWAMVLNLSAILSIYAVYVAFGEWVNLGAIILAYSVANFAGLVSVLPGGAGIYEALMTGVLAAGGIPAALSLPATIMFRVLSTLIQLPPGYYYYHKNVHSTGATPLDQPHEH